MKNPNFLLLFASAAMLAFPVKGQVATTSCADAPALQCGFTDTFMIMEFESSPGELPDCLDAEQPVNSIAFWHTLEDVGQLSYVQVQGYFLTGGLAIYEGTCGALEEVACATVNPEGLAMIDFEPEPGASYYLQAIHDPTHVNSSYTLEVTCPFTGIDCTLSIADYEVPECRSGDGTLEIGISGNITDVLFEHEVFLEAVTDAGLFFGNAQIDTVTGTFQGSITIQGDVLQYLVAGPGISLYNCGDGIEVNASLPVCPDCSALPHLIDTGSDLAPCVGPGAPGWVQVEFSGAAPQGRFGIADEEGNILASNSTGTFRMNRFPAGNYRIAHLAAPEDYPFSMITHIDQVIGCPALSNIIEVQSTVLNPGVIQPGDGVVLCADADAFPAFTANGTSGESFAWVLLNGDATEVVYAGEAPPESWVLPEPGDYRLLHLALGGGVDLSELNPGEELGCALRSQSVPISVHFCVSALQLWPNPTNEYVNLGWKPSAGRIFAIEVFNQRGDRALALNLAHDTEQQPGKVIDIRSLPMGIYEVVLTGEAHVLRQRLVVKP